MFRKNSALATAWRPWDSSESLKKQGDFSPLAKSLRARRDLGPLLIDTECPFHHDLEKIVDAGADYLYTLAESRERKRAKIQRNHNVHGPAQLRTRTTAARRRAYLCHGEISLSPTYGGELAEGVLDTFKGLAEHLPNGQGSELEALRKGEYRGDRYAELHHGTLPPPDKMFHSPDVVEQLAAGPQKRNGYLQVPAIGIIALTLVNSQQLNVAYGIGLPTGELSMLRPDYYFSLEHRTM